MTAPKKYVKINGVMKLNPEYKKYQEAQSGGTVPATTVARPDVALPVVSSMEDYAQLQSDMGTEVPMAESTSATIEMMQDPEICVAAGSKSTVAMRRWKRTGQDLESDGGGLRIWKESRIKRDLLQRVSDRRR